MVDDERIIDCAFVEVHADFWAVISCIWWRECIPFIVGGEIMLVVTVRVCVGA